MRRIGLGAVVALVAVFSLPTAAWADAVVTFESPGPDQVITTTTPVTVRIDRRFVDPHPETVTLRLSSDGAEPHERSAAVTLDCVEACDGEPSQTSSRWGGVELDPQTLAPFGDVPACNGRWWLLPDVQPGATARSDAAQGSFVVSRTPTPVQVAATVVDDAVDLRWGSATEADVVAFRIQRRADGTSHWTTLREVGPETLRFRDGPGEGEFHYRVVTVRPDGLVDGEPAAACGDVGADLTTASAVWTVTFAEDGATAAPVSDAHGSGDGGDQDGRDGSDAGDEDDGDGGGAPAGGGAADSPRDRISGNDGGGAARAPDLSSDGHRSRSDRFFGEDGPFSDELDYDGVDGLAGEEVTGIERLSGGVIEVFDRELDLEHVVPPVASGMLLVTVGLHLRRWVRETD